MNTSQFMDKQIMGLAGAGGQSGDLLELLSPPEDLRSNGPGGGKKDEILPSYDFQPIRRIGSPPAPPPSAGLDGVGAWGSAGSKPISSGFRNYSSLEELESSKVIHEKSRDSHDSASVDEIDCTVKKYADILLHALERMSSRLSKLEGRICNLESAVDDLKSCIGDSSGSTDGQLRQLENILREVQTGVQVIRDKQEIAEAQVQLAKLQASDRDQQPSENSVVPSNYQPPSMPPPQQHIQPLAPPSASPAPPIQIPALPAPPAPNAPLPLQPPQQNRPPVQFSAQAPQHQVSPISSMPPHEPYLPPPGQPPAEAPHQQYQPRQQQPQVPAPQSYPPMPQVAQYSQPPHSVAAAQLQPSLPHHPEESSPYRPPAQTYPPSIHQSPQLQIHQPPQLQSVPAPTQHIYGSTTNTYEPPTTQPASGQQPFPTGYGPPSGPSFSDSFPYGGPLSPYSSAREPSPFSSSPAPSSGSTYPRLPTARLLPHASPAGSSSVGSNANRVPLDDVVDNVTTMGFPRDLVKATVRKLTEDGQSVDLNTVLDKLMNGGEGQSRKGWFGR